MTRARLLPPPNASAGTPMTRRAYPNGERAAAQPLRPGVSETLVLRSRRVLVAKPLTRSKAAVPDAESRATRTLTR